MRKFSFLPFLFIFILIHHTLLAQQAGKQVAVKIPATHAVTNALLYLPWDYDISGKKYPLICFFHGMGEAGLGGADLNSLASQGLPGVIKQNHPPYSVSSKGDTTWFIVLSIQASWFSPTPETMIQGISSLINGYHLRIDGNRIYPTGLSAGGQQSLYSIMNYPSKFPAAVIMSPAAAIVSSKVDSFAHNHVWFFQGTSDQTVSPSNSYNSNKWINEKYSGHSRLTKYNGGHCCWMTYYDPTWKENGVSIYDFMLQYSLSDKDNTKPPVNQVPVAKASADQAIILPLNTVKLSASASFDPEGKIISY
jgi:predicted peptidase